MTDSVPPPSVPPEVAAAQEPWPAEPEGQAPESSPDERPAPAEPTPDELAAIDDQPVGALLARVAAERLDRLATPTQLGIVVLGTLAAFHNLASGGGASFRDTFSFFVTVGLLIVGGLVLGQSLHALAALLSAQADQAEATGRIEQRLGTGLDQLAAALETLAAAPQGASPAAFSAMELRAQHLAEIRQATRSGLWAEAEELVRRFTETHPDDPDISRVATDLAEARQAAGQELRARIEAAREVNDPDRVIELRDELKPLLEPDALKALDRDLARWFLVLISRRLRTGTIRTDVAMLAARVAESLDDTPEGASLRASLPTLRRAAGLCARCGQPYTGVADACPVCLAGPRAAPLPPPPPSNGSSADGATS